MPLQLAAVAGPAGQGSTRGSVISAAVTLAIILVLIATRVRGRRLQPARLLVLPLVLIAIGIGSSAPELPITGLHSIDSLIGGIDLLDSLIVGTIRGFTVRLYHRDGEPWYRYAPATVTLWLLSILIRAVLAIIGSAHHASPLTGGSDLLFMLGLALLCQNTVVVRRHVQRLGGPSRVSSKPAYRSGDVRR